MSKYSKQELLDEIAELSRISQLVSEIRDDVVSEALGINRTDHRVIDVLTRRGAIPAGELAGDAGLSPAAMTASIDRLERAGYARRAPDPADRRRILVDATPLAHERGWAIYQPLSERFARQASRYTVKELELIRDFLRRGTELVEEQIDEVREGMPGPMGGGLQRVEDPPRAG